MTPTHHHSDAIAVRIPGKFQIGLKTAVGAIVAIGTLGVTIFWMYSDKHNDERYVPKVWLESYDKDQSRVLQQLQKQEVVQDEMRKDIKELLKQKSTP